MSIFVKGAFIVDAKKHYNFCLGIINKKEYKNFSLFKR